MIEASGRREPPPRGTESAAQAEGPRQSPRTPRLRRQEEGSAREAGEWPEGLEGKGRSLRAKRRECFKKVERVTAWVLPRGQVWVEGCPLAEPVGVRVAWTGAVFRGYRSAQPAPGKLPERPLRCREGRCLSQSIGLRL